MAAAEDSLRRLNTDYIDLYLLHTPDADTAQEETPVTQNVKAGEWSLGAEEREAVDKLTHR